MLLRGLGSDTWAFARSARAHTAALRHLMASGHRSVRRWAFTTARDLAILEESELIQTAAVRQGPMDPGGVRGLVDERRATGLVPLLWRTRWKHVSLPSRGFPTNLSDNETLEQLLVDRAPRVREQARWRARKRQLDVVQIYRRLVKAERSARVRAASLDGIAVLGDDSDLPVIVSQIDDPSARVRSGRRWRHRGAMPSTMRQSSRYSRSSTTPRPGQRRGISRAARLRSPVLVEHFWKAARPADAACSVACRAGTGRLGPRGSRRARSIRRATRNSPGWVQQESGTGWTSVRQLHGRP